MSKHKVIKRLKHKLKKSKKNAKVLYSLWQEAEQNSYDTRYWGPTPRLTLIDGGNKMEH